MGGGCDGRTRRCSRRRGQEGFAGVEAQSPPPRLSWVVRRQRRRWCDGSSIGCDAGLVAVSRPVRGTRTARSAAAATTMSARWRRGRGWCSSAGSAWQSVGGSSPTTSHTGLRPPGKRRATRHRVERQTPNQALQPTTGARRFHRVRRSVASAAAELGRSAAEGTRNDAKFLLKQGDRSIRCRD